MSIVFKKKSQTTITKQVTDTVPQVTDAKTPVTDPNLESTTYAGKMSTVLDQKSTKSNLQSKFLSRSNFTGENRPETEIKIDITKPKFASYAHNSISGIIKNIAEIFYRRLDEDPAKLSTWEDKGSKLKIFQENFIRKNKSWCKFIELVVESTTKIDKNNKNSKNDSTFDSDLAHSTSASKQKNAILLRLINAMFSYVLVDISVLSTNTCVFPDDVLEIVWKLVIGFNTSTDIWSHIIDKLKNESKLSIETDTKINSVISFIQQHYPNVANNRFLISYIRVYLKNYEISLERKITFEVRVKHFVDILPDVFIVLDALYEIVNVLDSRHLRLLNEIQEIENNIEKKQEIY